MKKPYAFNVEIKFTECYRQYRDAPIAIREAKCLEQMYPAIFEEIKIGDRFAGRIKMSLIGFSPEPGGWAIIAMRRRYGECWRNMRIRTAFGQRWKISCHSGRRREPR